MKTLFCYLMCAGSLLAKFPENFSERLDVIALGSCNRESAEQPLWDVIAEQHPDLFIWMGDNIYADTEDMAVMKAKYDQQFNNPNYAAFRKKTPVIGTWDDHDYGENNSGAWFGPKADARDLALAFMEVPPDDPRWEREGIYGAYAFGPEGEQVKVLLIDDRYFATKPGLEDSDLLGEAQWAWLRDELTNSQAQVNLIVSGIQVLPRDHRFEMWNRFPESREALLSFIREQGVSGVVFASGDRHIHEISIKSDEQAPYPLLELTSSGMTHSWGENFPGERNRFRSGPVHPGKGFGLIELDWDAEPATITLKIVNDEGGVENQLTLPIRALSAEAQG